MERNVRLRECQEKNNILQLADGSNHLKAEKLGSDNDNANEENTARNKYKKVILSDRAKERQKSTRSKQLVDSRNLTTFASITAFGNMIRLWYFKLNGCADKPFRVEIGWKSEDIYFSFSLCAPLLRCPGSLAHTSLKFLFVFIRILCRQNALTIRKK